MDLALFPFLLISLFFTGFVGFQYVVMCGEAGLMSGHILTTSAITGREEHVCPGVS